MSLKKLFGALISAALAYAVARLLDWFDGAVTAAELAGTLVLFALYFTVFRAGLSRESRIEAGAAIRQEAPVECGLDEMEECFQPA